MSIEIINAEPYKKQPLPEIGKEYHIFDDGKIRLSRHSICKISEIIPFNECTDLNLLKAWKNMAEDIYWLFAKETDYFIVGNVKSGEDVEVHNFVRTLDGGWFSIDYPKSWSASRLDIDGSLYEKMEEMSNVL